MINRRFPWRIFFLSLITQLAVFNALYGFIFLFKGVPWDFSYVLITSVSCLLSTLIFIRPVYALTNSLKAQKAELHREREESQTLLGIIQEAVVTFNLKKQIIFFNTQFAILFLGRVERERKRSIQQVFSQPELLDAIEEVLKSAHTKKVRLKIPTLIESQARYFNVSLTPVLMQKNQEMYEVVAVFHDITDIKKAESIRIDFVGNASHELRTPLTSIKGYVETLRDDINSKRFDQADRFISIVSRNVDRLIDLVNDLLNLSKMESGTELKLSVLSPMSLTQSVVGELALLAQEKNIVIHSHCEISQLMADPQKVEQVLRNLISNAIKYIPEEKQIDIEWKRLGQEVILVVSDNGPGIPDEHHARLFERFYRIDRGRSRETGGTGLGLAIVKHIMQSHGGSIEVKSQMGSGTQFTCRFPQIEANLGSSRI
jgi:two-component system phosphate regulon sensor histidine kinase PhoR